MTVVHSCPNANRKLKCVTTKVATHILLMTFLAFLGGCIPDGHNPKKKEDIQVVAGKLGQETFFIPKDYFRIYGFDGGSISLEMIQPEFIPLQKSTMQMWKDGEQVKYILIYANEQRSKEDFSLYVTGRMSQFYAFKELGSEYGLVHFTQLKGHAEDWQDVWVERNGKKNISYITCDDDSGVPVPQCTHSFEIGTVYIQIHYDKRNLPKWKFIHDNVTSAFASFRTVESAQSVLFQKYTNYKKQHGEK